MYTKDSGSTWNTPSVRYLSMEALMSAMYSSTLGAFRLASGRISRREINDTSTDAKSSSSGICSWVR